MRLLSKKACNDCSFLFYRSSLKFRSVARLPLSPLSLGNFSTTVITPQEKPYESFFRHDSGRWLYNEDLRLAETYQEFDVQALKRVAARAINQKESDVSSIVKSYEDDLSGTFTITLRNESRVIARVPHPGTMHKRYSTTSEVATMDFARKHKVATPKVLAYDITADNEVGTQYILMEAAGGQNLGERWDSIDEDARRQIVMAVAYQKAKLMNLRLPASGSIYYKRDLEPGIKTVEISRDLDEKFGAASGDGFCIGPSVNNDWWLDERAEMGEISRGPWQSSEDYLRSVAERELAWMKQYARPRYPSPVEYRRFFRYEQVPPEGHINSLEEFLRIVQHLIPRQLSRFNDVPILQQNNMQLRDLFVSSTKAMEKESDPMIEIVSTTNWGQASVLPRFIQAGVPPSLSDMSEFYIQATRSLDLAHTIALQDITTPAGRLTRSLYRAVATPWNGNSVMLKALLLLAVRKWPELTGVTGATVLATEILKSGVKEGKLPKKTIGEVEKLLNPEIPACPLSYSSEEVERIDYFVDKFSQVDELFDRLRKGMQLGPDGFVSHDSYKDAKLLSEWTKKRLIEIAEDKHVEKYEYGVMWPFDDHDESGQFCPITFDDDGQLRVWEKVEPEKDG